MFVGFGGAFQFGFLPSKPCFPWNLPFNSGYTDANRHLVWRFPADESQISFSFFKGGPAREPDLFFFFLIRPNTDAKYALEYSLRNKSGQFRKNKKEKKLTVAIG